MALSEHDFTITTNSLENINGKLKSKVGTGFLSRPKAYKKLKEFHSDYICLYTAKVVHNRMPKIKPKTLKREHKLLEKLEEFHSLPCEHRMNYDALAFGNGFVPSLNEIQEAQSSSILSFK